MDEYSRLDKLLHRAVLKSNTLGEALFDLERHLYLKRPSAPLRKMDGLFVTGLARAGTTTLMRALYSSNQFASLTYLDMPFVMSPNLWRHLSKRFRKSSQKQERAHGDGIIVDFDSPEAFEEVFWRVFHGKDYIGDTFLSPHDVSLDTLESFRAYLALICMNHDKRRYLSKNNNNILRLKSLSVHLSDCLFLVPFRNPLDQAYSLLRQHRRFEGEAPFVKDYMTWLSHFEFGPDHRPFRLAGQNRLCSDTHDINYWLEIWIEVYLYLLEFQKSEPANVFFVSYERLCDDPVYWNAICQLASIPNDTTAQFIAPRQKEPSGASADLLQKSRSVYEECLQLSLRP